MKSTAFLSTNLVYPFLVRAYSEVMGNTHGKRDIPRKKVIVLEQFLSGNQKESLLPTPCLRKAKASYFTLR